MRLVLLELELFYSTTFWDVSLFSKSFYVSEFVVSLYFCLYNLCNLLQLNKRWRWEMKTMRDETWTCWPTKQTMRDENDERWDMNLLQLNKRWEMKTMRDETWTSRMQRNKWWEMNLERWRYPMMKMRDTTQQTMRDTAKMQQNKRWEMILERWRSMNVIQRSTYLVMNYNIYRRSHWGVRSVTYVYIDIYRSSQ